MCRLDCERFILKFVETFSPWQSSSKPQLAIVTIYFDRVTLWYSSLHIHVGGIVATQRMEIGHMCHLTSKSTKWHMPPAKTQISLGIRPVWSESSLSTWRNVGSLATHGAHSEDCPGWSESLLGAQSFCWFCHEAAHCSGQVLQETL